MTAENVLCRIEIPKGSRNKYEFDPALGAIKLDRFLFSSVVYPTDYGYVPETLAEDGDPLDAMVCVTEPTFAGCFIESRLIALFRMRDDKARTTSWSAFPTATPTGARWSTSRTCRSSFATRSPSSSACTSNHRASE